MIFWLTQAIITVSRAPKSTRVPHSRFLHIPILNGTGSLRGSVISLLKAGLSDAVLLKIIVPFSDGCWLAVWVERNASSTDYLRFRDDVNGVGRFLYSTKDVEGVIGVLLICSPVISANM